MPLALPALSGLGFVILQVVPSQSLAIQAVLQSLLFDLVTLCATLAPGVAEVNAGRRRPRVKTMKKFLLASASGRSVRVHRHSVSVQTKRSDNRIGGTNCRTLCATQRVCSCSHYWCTVTVACFA